ncbi:DNA ligase 1-like isoform X1 [Salvia splendens]|uniref:DNA ligase 1-like isoform X1 n=1 Tax=Salvia splendens TaxID=180675 RepID=UPI001102BA2E|nr:DNA ligase 1-like isoform X1 [Salvia splendens]XP_042009580.1 DNA ligase 1-like isoform X1 [Salvia splendens]XP_042009581.1 DNA ligase 1-like isoform X1 [Salvia splendens]
MASPPTLVELKRSPSDYTLSNVVHWELGGDVPFVFLANCLVAVSEAAEDDLQDIACNIFRTFMKISPQNLFAVLSILARTYTDGDNSYTIEASKDAIIEAIAESSNKTPEFIKDQLLEHDLAFVAEVNRPIELLFKREKLTIEYLFSKIIALVENVKRKKEKKKVWAKRNLYTLLGMFNHASEFEAGTLVRLLQPIWKKVPENVILHGLACATVYAHISPEDPDIPMHLERAVDLCNRIYQLVKSFRAFCDAFCHTYPCTGYMYLPEIIGFAPGIPLKLMEAEPILDTSELFQKFGSNGFTYESNDYGDVIRAQIHGLENGVIVIYVDNELVTDRFPDVLAIVMRARGQNMKSFIIDCKVCAFDERRKTSLSIKDLPNSHWEDAEIVVSIVVSDILYLNGKSLLQKQLLLRHQMLQRSFVEQLDSSVNISDVPQCNDLKLLKSFLKAAGKSSLIVKSLTDNATYEPCKKLRNWLILRKEDLADLEKKATDSNDDARVVRAPSKEAKATTRDSEDASLTGDNEDAATTGDSEDAALTGDNEDAATTGASEDDA